MMEVMLAKDKPLSELAAPVVFYPQVLKNVRVKSKPDAQNDPDVQKVADALGDDGRILVRESGTEPVIRVMVEAGSDQICEENVDSVIKVIADKGHLV
jgi:phosphoglucosamine mutase